MTNKVASFNKMLLLLFLMFFDFKKKDNFCHNKWIFHCCSLQCDHRAQPGETFLYHICNTCSLELSRFKIKHVLRHEANIAIRHFPFYLKSALLTRNGT